MRDLPKAVHPENTGASRVSEPSQAERLAAARTANVPGEAIAGSLSYRARQRRREVKRAVRLATLADRLIVAILVADILLCHSTGRALDVLAAVTIAAVAAWFGVHHYARRIAGNPR